MSEIVGSLGVELFLDRGKYDRQLKALQTEKGGVVQFAASLDARALRRQIDNLSRVAPTITVNARITNLNALEGQLKTFTRNRTISVGVQLDERSINRQLQSLTSSRIVRLQAALINTTAIENQIATLTRDRIVRVGFEFDESGLSQKLSKYTDRSFKVTAQVDDSRLTALNKHLDLKQKHFGQVNNYFSSRPLTPKTDLSYLDALGKRLDDFKNSTINIGVNVADVRSQIADLRSQLSSLSVPITVRNASATQSVTQKVTTDTSAIEQNVTQALNRSFKGLEKNVTNAFSKIGKGNALGGIGDILTAPFKLATNAIGGIAGNLASGLVLGITQPVGSELGQGLSKALQKSVSSSFGTTELLGQYLGESLVEGIGSAFKGNKLQKFVQDATKEVSQDMRSRYGETFYVETRAATAKQKQQQAQKRRIAEPELEQEFQTAAAKKPQVQAAVQRAETARPQLKQDIEAYNQRFKAAQKQVQEESEQIQVNLTAKQIADRKNQQRQQLEEAAIQLAKEGKQKEALAFKQAANNMPVAKPEDITDKEIQAFNQVATAQARQQFTAKQLSPFTAQKQSLMQRVQALRQDDAFVAKSVAELEEASMGLDLVRKASDGDPKVKRRTQITQSQPLPSIYRQVFDEVATRSGIDPSRIDPSRIPQLVANPNISANANAQYAADLNQVQVSSHLLDVINSGTATQKQIDTLIHELRHAFQSGLGQNLTEQSSVELLRPNGQESREFGRKIEGSVAGSKGYSPEYARQIEADAYTFTARNSNDISTKLGRSQAISQIESSLGVGGGKAALKLEKAQKLVFSRIIELSKTASVDVTDEMQAAFAASEQAIGRFNAALTSLEDLELLPVKQIQALQQALEAELNQSVNEVLQQADQFKSEVASKPDKVRSQMSDSLGQFNRKKDLVPLAQEFGIENADQLNKKQLIEQLSNNTDLRALQPRVNQMTQERAQQQLVRQERIASVAQTAGAVTRGTVQAGQSVFSKVGEAASSDAAKQILGAGGATVRGLGAAAKASYKLASAIESVALDMVPMGRTAKGVLKQTAVPALAFGAATHFLPGGGMIAEGANHLMQGALTPLMHGGADALSGQASGMISQFAPKAFGIQAHMTGAVTGMIEGAINSAIAPVTQAVTAVVGGKMLTGAAGNAVKPVLPSSTAAALPPATNKALPSAPTLALPASPQTEVVENPFEGFTNPQLLAASRKLGIKGVNTRSSKDTLLSGLKGYRDQGEVDRVLAQVRSEISKDGKPVAGFDKKAESAAIKQFEKAEKDLNKKISQLATATGAKREKLINEILSGTQNAIAQIDQIKGQNFSGETVRSLSGIQGRIENSYRNNPTLNDARNERIGTARSAAVQSSNQRNITGLARVAIPEQEAATFGKTLKEGFRKLTNLAAKQFDVQPQPTIKGTLGSIAKSPKARDLATDLAVNGAGFAASKIGAHYGIVPELTGDLAGALAMRQAISRGRPSAKDMTGDLSGFAIGNGFANLANAGLDAMTGIVPGAGVLRALPFKGAIAASAMVPKVTKATDKYQNPEGLARVGSGGLIEKFKSLLPSNQKKADQLKANYEAIYREIAKVSGVAFDPKNMPRLSIDANRLKKLGADAFYDIEKNAIVIDQSLAKILSGRAGTLQRNAEKIKGLVHEGRHSVQLNQGQLNLEQAATGQNVRLMDGRNLTRSQRNSVESSVNVVRRQGASSSQINAAKVLETDAYAFENKTQGILARVGATEQSTGASRIKAAVSNTIKNAVGTVTDALDRIGLGKLAFDAQLSTGVSSRRKRSFDRRIANGNFTPPSLENSPDLDGLVEQGVQQAERQALEAEYQRADGNAAKTEAEVKRRKMRNRDRRRGTIRAVLNPEQYIKERGENAALTSARTLLDDSDTITGRIRKQIEESPNNKRRRNLGLDPQITTKQAKAITQVEDGYGRLGAAVESYQSDRSVENLKELRGAIAQVEGGLKTLKVPSGLPPITKGFEQLGEPLSKVAGFAKNAVAGFLGFTVLSTIGPAIQQFAAQSLQAAIALDKVRNALNFSTGGKAAESLKTVGSEAERLGIPLQSAQQGYSKLLASTRGTAVQGKPSEELFKGLNAASTVLGLGDEEYSGSILALSQMASKGKVQAEELRGQLGERIPGAFGIAARSMNVSEAELNKRLEQGAVSAEDFLPRFGRQLQIEFGGSAKSAAGGTQASINRLNSSALEFQQAQGALFTPAVAQGANVLAGALKLVTGNFEAVVTTATALGATLGLQFAIPLGMAVANIGLVQKGLGLLAGGLGAVKTALIPLAVKFAAVTAVIEVGKNIFDRFLPDDLGSQFKTLADQAEENLERIRKSAANARGEVSQVGNPSKKPKSNGIVDDALIGLNNIGEKTGIAKVDKFIYDRTRNIPVLDQVGAALFTPFETSVQAQERNRQTEIDRTVKGGQNTLGAVNLPFFEEQLQKAQGIDRQVTLLQNDRNRLSAQPKPDRDKIKGIDQQIKGLNEQRTSAVAPVVDAQAALQGLINGVETNLNNPDLKPEQKKQLEEELKKYKEAETAINQLQNGFSTAADRVADFRKSLAELNIDLDNIKRNATIEFNIKSANAINQQIADAATDENASLNNPVTSAQLQSEQSQTVLDQTNARLAQIKPKLETQEAKDTLAGIVDSTTGKSISADSSFAEIEKAKQSTQNEKTKGILDELLAYKSGLEQRTDMEKQAANDRKVLQQAEFDRKMALIDREMQQRELANRKSVNVGQVALIRRQKDKSISEEDAAIESAKLSQKQTGLDLSSARQQLEALNAAKAAGQISEEQFQQKRLELEGRVSDLTLKKAQDELNLREAVNRKILEGFERRNRVAAARIDAGASDAIANIRTTQLNGGMVGEGGQTETAKVELDAAQQKQALKQQELAEVKKLRDQRVLSEKEAADRTLAIEQELRDARSRIIDLQVQQRLNAIQSESDARKRAIDVQIRDLEKLKAADDLINANLERRKALLETQSKLGQATSDLRQSSLKIGVDRASEAGDLQKSLREGNLGQNSARVARSQLSELGFSGGNELQTLAAKQALEAEMDAEKLAALQQQQALEQQSLQLQFELEKIAARRALNEAKIAENKALQNAIDAQSELQKAKISGDANQIANAQGSVENANQGIELAKQGVQIAQENNAALQDRLKLEQQINDAKQQQTQNELTAQNAANRRGRERDFAAMQDQMGGSAGGIGGGIGGGISGGGSSGGGGSQGQVVRSMMLFGNDIEANRRGSGDIQYAIKNAFGGRKGQEEAVLRVLQNSSGRDRDFAMMAASDMGYGNIVEALTKIENAQSAASPSQKLSIDSAVMQAKFSDDVVGAIQQLGDRIDNLANRPSIVSISTPDPISDYASFLNQQSSSTLRNS